MAEQYEYPFAEIDSKEEIVVHLGRLAEPMTLPYLAELLRVPARVILAHSMLPLNEEFARRLYSSVRATYKELPGADGGDPVALPDGADLRLFEVTIWTTLVWERWRGEGQPDLWELPGVDLYLPREESLTRQLGRIYARGTTRDRIVEIEQIESIAAGIQPLKDAVEKLERAIARKLSQPLGRGESAGDVLAGISMIRSCFELQHRHWEAVKKLTEHESSLGNMQTSLSNLEEALWREFDVEFIEPERRAADELLDVLDATRGNAAVHRAIEVCFTRPAEVHSKEADDVIGITIRACSALARSARVTRFVEEHAVDLIEEGGLVVQPTVELLLAGEGRKLGADALAEWDALIAALKAGIETRPAAPSVLRCTQHGVRAYRLGLSVMNAVLEQGVVAQVMTYLCRGLAQGSYSPSVMQDATRGFALLILRNLANSAVQHRAAKGELFLVGGERFKKILERLATFDEDVSNRAAAVARGDDVADATKFWTERGRALRDLQVRPLPRTGGGASFRVFVSVIALGIAARPAFGKDGARADEVWAIWAAGLNLVEHTGRLLEFTSNGAPLVFALAKDELQTFDRTMKLLAGVAALFSAVGGSIRAQKAFAKGDVWNGLIQVSGATGNALVAVGQIAMGPGQGAMTELWALRWLRWGAQLNAIGVAICIAAFIVEIAYLEFKKVGMRRVLPDIVAAIESMPRSHSLRIRFSRLRQAIEDNESALSEFTSIPGNIDDDMNVGQPTYWKAAKLGFSERAVGAMFGVKVMEVHRFLASFYAPRPEPKDQ